MSQVRKPPSGIDRLGFRVFFVSRARKIRPRRWIRFWGVLFLRGEIPFRGDGFEDSLFLSVEKSPWEINLGNVCFPGSKNPPMEMDLEILQL